MFGITAEIVLDSVSPAGVRLTTLQLKFPRFILAEFNTHRVLSRNAASSRAIPTKKLVEQVRNDPVIPFWGKNQPGMQAREELSDQDKLTAEAIWREAAGQACIQAERLANLGVHKQAVNRVLEPYLDAHVIVSATEWGNFFNLRRHPDAQPEMKSLADAMWQAMQASTPKKLEVGGWHLPYVTEAGELDWLRKLSVARCARVSYLTHDNAQPDPQKDVELHGKLMASGHWSPFEHQATPNLGHQEFWMVGNLRGWTSYRKFCPNENRTEYKP